MNDISADHEAIRAIIKDYFEGVSNAKEEPLKRVWDESSGHWKGVAVGENGVEAVRVEPIKDSSGKKS